MAICLLTISANMNFERAILLLLRLVQKGSVTLRLLL